MSTPAFVERNKKAIEAQEALIEKFMFGQLDVSVEFHNKKIVKQTFFGKERRRYGKANQDDALKDILKRLKQSMDRKETTELVFQVNVRNGVPEQVLWLTQHTINYDVDNGGKNV